MARRMPNMSHDAEPSGEDVGRGTAQPQELAWTEFMRSLLGVFPSIIRPGSKN